jgi:hypothetical protein
VTRRRRSFPAAFGVLAVLLAGGSLYLWTLDRPWCGTGWRTGLSTIFGGMSFVAGVAQGWLVLREWLSPETQENGRAPTRVVPVVAALLVLGATLAVQPLVASGEPGTPPQATASTGMASPDAPSSNASPSTSPSGEPVRPTTAGPAPSSVAKAPLVAPTTPSPAPSGTRFPRTVSGTGSTYLNLDVQPFTVADEPGNEQKFDLHVEPGQVTPMNNTVFGPQADGEQCAATTDYAKAYPFPPGRFCGTTRAGQSFVITIAHGDGNILNVVVELP